MPDSEMVLQTRKRSAMELKCDIGIDHTPNILELIDYLEKMSTIHPVGRMSTYASVNKEALRLAAVYLRDMVGE